MSTCGADALFGRCGRPAVALVTYRLDSHASRLLEVWRCVMHLDRLRMDLAEVRGVLDLNELPIVSYQPDGSADLPGMDEICERCDDPARVHCPECELPYCASCVHDHACTW